MRKWYIDKIKDVAPELLDGDAEDISDWIDNTFGLYAEDKDIAAAMDDVIKDQEEYYGVDLDRMSRAQLLTTAAKLRDAIESN